MRELTDNICRAIKKSGDGSLKAIDWLGVKKKSCLPVLNGIVGDSLVEHKSSFALGMDLMGEVRGKKVCILVHGLCDSDKSWQYPNDTALNYGSLLNKDLGYSPLLLRYNSGLHISTNGQRFNELLTQIWRHNRHSKREIVFIGHSMGGLVIRSACHYGQAKNAPWVKQVKKVFLLGTPHLGVDWERLGHFTSVILHKVPSLVTKGLALLGNKRSAGIKDLRFGYLLDEDWKGQNNEVFWHDNRHQVPLLKNVDYFILAAKLAKESKNIFSEYFGDGLVPSRSASGKSFFKSKTIPFPPNHYKALKGLSHRDLSHHPKVYQFIKKWCA